MTQSFAARMMVVLALLLGVALAASAQISPNPTSISFGNTEVEMESTRALTLTNIGNSPTTIVGFVFSSPVFGMADGVFPKGLGAGGDYKYSIAFKPTAARSYSGTLTVDLMNGTTATVPLSGTGVLNAGVPSVSATSLNFGNLPLGSSAVKNVTITNTGTASFQVSAITTYAPFTIGGFSKAVDLGAGASLKFQVSYSAGTLGTVSGDVTISYDLHPSQGIDLTGAGTTPSGLAVTTFPSLPSAVSKYPYMATLQATGGTPPYNWELTSGSVSGVTLSRAGVLSGTVASTAPPGNYPVNVTVQDSSKQRLKATAVLSLPVAASTGANCNITSIDVVGTSSPVVALNDLGTGTYQGYEGGLYPDGSNVDPTDHQSSAVSIAQGIQPLDSNGNPDPNGIYVLISLGPSTAEQPFIDFVNAATADPQKNSHLVVVDAALGGETANLLSDPASGYWTTIFDYILPLAGVTTKQVVATWVNAIDSTSAAFPGNAQTLQSQLESVAQNMHTFFPNLVLSYFDSLNYTGYSQGVSTLDPEPQGYESAFGAKWAIQDQINGNANLNWDPNVGPVLAPWMGWGPYYWANGLLARNDGTYWACPDVKNDGVHPVYPGGNLKITSALLDFFKSDTSATPWYLAPGSDRAGH